MKKIIFAALTAAALAGSANAGIVTLQNVAANGANDFGFNYRATLGPDEGLRTGDRFVIFDFAGYIAGSIFSSDARLIASTETLSPTALVTPGQTDDASLANLVFTYVGPSFRTASGPLAPFDFPSIGARSTFGGTILDAFFSLSTKNNPAGERGRAIYTLGSVSVPFNSVPEPASWAMMLGGFAAVGAAMRRRGGGKIVTA